MAAQAGRRGRTAPRSSKGVKMKLKAALAGAAFAAVAAAGLVGTTFANHTPADKPFAAASKSMRTGPAPRIELLSATVKNSKPTDLVLQVSMECSIITDNVIIGSTVPGASESATTAGKVRAWIEVDGKIVPIVSTGAGEAGDDSDKVTFCNRVFERTVQDTEDPQDGFDGSRDYIATKSANAFNWVRLNVGSGTHTIKLLGEFSQQASAGSTADAYIGTRSMIGIPGKFANDAVISETGN